MLLSAVLYVYFCFICVPTVWASIRTQPLLDAEVDVEFTGAGRTPLCQLLKFLLNNLRYQIRLHLLSKPHYNFQFRQFALENHIFSLDVANACQVLF